MSAQKRKEEKKGGRKKGCPLGETYFLLLEKGAENKLLLWPTRRRSLERLGHLTRRRRQPVPGPAAREDPAEPAWRDAAAAPAPRPAPLSCSRSRTGPPRPSAPLSLPLGPRRAPLACSLVCSEPQRSARDESLQWHDFNSTLFILQPLYHVNPTPPCRRSARGGGGRRPRRRGRRRKTRGRGGRSAPHLLPAPGRADASRTPCARKEGGGGGGRTAGAVWGAEAAWPIPTPGHAPWSVPLAHVAKDGHLR